MSTFFAFAFSFFFLLNFSFLITFLLQLIIFSNKNDLVTDSMKRTYLKSLQQRLQKDQGMNCLQHLQARPVNPVTCQWSHDSCRSRNLQQHFRYCKQKSQISHKRVIRFSYSKVFKYSKRDGQKKFQFPTHRQHLFVK